VIAVDEFQNTENSFRLQTFRIDSKTTFKILREQIHNFWQFYQDDHNFALYILENNGLLEIRNNEEVEVQGAIDAFLKSRSSLKKAQFLYIPNIKKSIQLINLYKSISWNMYFI